MAAPISIIRNCCEPKVRSSTVFLTLTPWPALVVGYCRARRPANRLKRRLGLRYRHAVFQASKHRQRVVLAVFVRRPGQVERGPDFRSGGKIKIWRRNANHGELLTVQEQLPAHKPRIAAQMLLPESVADDHHRRNPALKIRAPDIAAQLRSHAQQWKKVGGYL